MNRGPSSESIQTNEIPSWTYTGLRLIKLCYWYLCVSAMKLNSYHTTDVLIQRVGLSTIPLEDKLEITLRRTAFNHMLTALDTGGAYIYADSWKPLNSVEDQGFHTLLKKYHTANIALRSTILKAFWELYDREIGVYISFKDNPLKVSAVKKLHQETIHLGQDFLIVLDAAHPASHPYVRRNFSQTLSRENLSTMSFNHSQNL